MTATGTAPLRRTGERTTARVDLTPRASRRIRSLLAGRSGEGYGLRLSMDESGNGATSYLLSLSSQPYPGDLVLPRNGFEVFVPRQHVDQLDGVRIDFVESSTTAGFVVDPPVRSPRSRRPVGDGMAGDVPDGGAGGEVPGPPEVVSAVREAIASVRPALQSDGGDIELVGVVDGVAWVELAGACSSCSSAMLTLTDLVEAVIVAAVPAVQRVELTS